jgi:hypothetical protein
LRALYEQARQDAFLDYHDLKYHPLFIAGVMTYWSHGEVVSKSRIVFSSSDCKMVRIFVSFLENVCGKGDYRVKINRKSDLSVSEEEIKAYWIENCGLKSSFFLKTGQIKSVGKGKSGNKIRKYGICNIILTSAYLKSKILKWIELLSSEIGEGKLENY